MKTKKLKLKGTTKVDMATYLGVILVYVAVVMMNNGGLLNRSQKGWLVPVCCYIVMAISLNLVVGVSGELSLGHAGFMCVGAFSGIVTSMSLGFSALPDPSKETIEAIRASDASAIAKFFMENGNAMLRLSAAMLVGALVAAIAGVLIGIPVLRLRGDYLAIVTLAFGEIIKDLVNLLVVGVDSRGVHMILNISGKRTESDLHLEAGSKAFIKGAQGAVGVTKLATFGAGFILVMIALVVVLHLMRSRSGRAIMAIRDNRIAAESVGINITKYKMMAFVTSAALAGAAGALYALNFGGLKSDKFSFNTSIFVLVYVVLGGLGNIWGSIVAATALYILPEALRSFQKYRMLIYAIALIIIMLATNNPFLKSLPGRAVALAKKIWAKIGKKPAPTQEGGDQQ